MTRQAVIELVQQSLARQNANNDQNLIKGYIAIYMAQMLNYLVLKQYYLDLKTGTGHDISGLFYANYNNVPLKKDEKRNEYYIDLPQKVVALPGDKGIPYVGSMQDDNQFPMLGQGTMFTAKKWLQFTKWVFCQIEGQRVYFKNLPVGMAELLKETGVLLKMVLDAYELGDDDEVPVPAGMEIEFINGIVDFFLGKKRIPQDTIPNNKDI